MIPQEFVKKFMILFALIRKIKKFAWQILWVFRNFSQAIFLPKIKSHECDGLIFEGLEKTDFSRAMKIYKNLNNVKRISIEFLYLYRIFGNKLCFVAKNKKNEIIAVEFYYFNKRDIKEHTVHQSFRGVIPEYRRRGIATTLTSYVIEHFTTTKVQGISSRVSLSNEGRKIAVSMK